MNTYDCMKGRNVQIYSSISIVSLCSCFSWPSNAATLFLAPLWANLKLDEGRISKCCYLLISSIEAFFIDFFLEQIFTIIYLFMFPQICHSFMKFYLFLISILQISAKLSMFFMIYG